MRDLAVAPTGYIHRFFGVPAVMVLRKTFSRPVPKIARGADLGPSNKPTFHFGSATNQIGVRRGMEQPSVWNRVWCLEWGLLGGVFLESGVVSRSLQRMCLQRMCLQRMCLQRTCLQLGGRVLGGRMLGGCTSKEPKGNLGRHYIKA
jgi:hypothetical protein